MPEHLRALVVILVLATAVFWFARSPACAVACNESDFLRRRNLWISVTLIVFLAHNFWAYIVATAILFLVTGPREFNKLAMYFALLFAAPTISAEITGFGVVDHLFSINYLRLLALTVLLPAFLNLRSRLDTEAFGKNIFDKFVVAYLVLTFLLILRSATFTNALRHGIFYSFIDIFLPYYVASRSLKSYKDFQDTLMAFVVAAMALGLIGVFEFGKKWLLYSALTNSLGIQRSIFDIYLLRGESGSLRAQGSTGQPIPFGYVMAVATGFFLYLKNAVPRTMTWNLGFALLMAGLVAGLSRGPWVGAAVIALIYIATGPARMTGFFKLTVAGAVGLPLLIASPIGNRIIDLMPFVGTVDEFNVTYRQRLLEISIEVIKQNPIFGSADAMSSPMMQELVQGQGMIDLVNSYLGVALATGLAGLILFSGIFITIGIALLNAIQKQKRGRHDDDLLGRALFSTLVGILVMIFTVSSISVIPVIYWAIAGMSVAYLNMLSAGTIAAPIDSTNSAPPPERPHLAVTRQNPLSSPTRIAKR